MLQEEQEYFIVIDEGKKEFELSSTIFKNSLVMIVIGIILILFVLAFKLKILPEEAIAILGIAMIFFGSLSFMISRRNKPRLPIKARILLKKLGK